MSEIIDSAIEDLRAAWRTCCERQRELRAQMQELRRTESQLTADLAPRLCGILPGAIFVIPKGRYGQGRWRVKGYRFSYGEHIELIATKLKKNGTDSKADESVFLDWQNLTFEAPHEEKSANAR